MNSSTKFVQSATGTGVPNANNSKRAQMLFVHTVAQGQTSLKWFVDYWKFITIKV